MQNVTIFGGSGSLGCRLARELRAEGYSVTNFDFKEPSNNADYNKTIVGNVEDLASVTEACKSARYVYNLICSENAFLQNAPIKTVQVDIAGNVNIMEACLKQSVERFIFTSSHFSTHEPETFYHASKLACERYIEIYSQQYNLNFTIIRFCSTFGSPNTSTDIVYNLVNQALCNSDLPINISDSSKYLDIADVATACSRILASQYTNKNILLESSQRYELENLVNEAVSELTHEHLQTQTIHQALTPKKQLENAYRPRPGKKLVVNPFVDMGQGILECIHEIQDELKNNHAHEGI